MVIPSQGKRVSKIDTYLNCAEVFAYRSTCIKRKYGAVIVKDDVVISTGYNGAPRGFDNCCDLIRCLRNVYLRLGDGPDNYEVVPAKDLEWVQKADM